MVIKFIHTNQHDRLNMEKLQETHGPNIVKTSDIARLMELFQVRQSKCSDALSHPAFARVHCYVIGSSTRKAQIARILRKKRKLVMRRNVLPLLQTPNLPPLKR